MPTTPDQDLINDRSERIVLSRATSFHLGEVEIRPATREVVGPETRQVLQPRVMQVLVALHNAGGEIVSRDDLTLSCWDGVVVGEDSINRVISQLRRVGETVGKGSFGIETITKVGYRLTRSDAPVTAVPPPPPAEGISTGSRSIGRRGVLIGGGGLLAAGAIGGGALWLLRPSAPPEPTPLSARLLSQALTASLQGTREGRNQAIGMLRRAVAEQPDFADGWGALSMIYAIAAVSQSREGAGTLRGRAIEAASRSEAIEPGNAFAAVGRTRAVPLRGAWLPAEQALRAAMARHPNQDALLAALAEVLAQVGRNREALPLFEELVRQGNNNPWGYFRHIEVLWSAGRLDDADRMMQEAHQLYSTHFMIWFVRAYIQMYTGRASATIDMLRDIPNRPTGIAADEFDQILVVAQALVSRAPSDIDQAIALWNQRARTGAGYAENAIQFAAALGRADESFALLDAYFFGRGFTVPEVRFTVEQGSYMPIEERQTVFLFFPCLAPLHADPRFPRLLEELGLTAYWRDSGSRPDVGL